MATELCPAIAKPFLKWVGGKSQLLSQFDRLLPPAIRSGWRGRYFEPFLGGGAMLFDVLQRFQPAAAIASDLNADLINVYRAIQVNVTGLIAELQPLAESYLASDHEQRSEMFYAVREKFNQAVVAGEIELRRAAQLLFLNKTCFNGLYRVNREGKFNTPSGAWKQTKPLICDADNLRAVSVVLQGMRLECAAYDSVEAEARAGDFVYFDPPYRPLTKTSSFESYTAGGFGDEQQRQLAGCFTRLAARGVLVMLSNSDPRSADPDDTFFDELYRDFSVHRVQAARMVNAKAAGRGRISEILVTSW